jgi:hypothetical protein
VRRDYCTLFDSNYVTRALALYRSLERCETDFLLRAVCMDEESLELLSRLSLPRMRLIAIEELERDDPALLATRPTRTPWEYCWTTTAAMCHFILRGEPSIEILTYLDADLCFFSSPSPMFDDLGRDSILLVPHRNDVATGIFNVGWVSFHNDEHGRAAIAWWRERCLEWCFDRLEPHRYGDQKYLDDWPTRFAGVKVCENTAAGLGPWNEGLSQLGSNAAGAVLVDRAPLIFYHHTGLRLHRGETPSARLASRSRRFQTTRSPARLTWSLAYDVSGPSMELIWKPYVAQLAKAVGELRSVGAAQTLGMQPTVLRTVLGRLWTSEPVAPLRKVHKRMPVRWQRAARRAASAR